MINFWDMKLITRCCYLVLHLNLVASRTCKKSTLLKSHDTILPFFSPLFHALRMSIRSTFIALSGSCFTAYWKFARPSWKWNKIECIPVGCVPPGGVCQGLGGVYPGCCLPRYHVTCDCWDTQSPCGQNSWHTLVKTLPSRNYCCSTHCRNECHHC